MNSNKSNNKSSKAIFLDRDGVINKAIVINGKPYPPKTVDETQIIPGVQYSINEFKKNGYLIIVITNQPDVARGKTSVECVEKINKFLQKTLKIDKIYSCYHDTNDNCKCRKPLPGNILKACKLFDINLKESIMIGDRRSDIEAGINAGVKTVFIDYNYTEIKPLEYNFRVESLREALPIILGENK